MSFKKNKILETDTSKREWVLKTDIKNLNAINNEMKREVCKSSLSNAFKKGLFTEEQKDNLLKMIASSDMENLVVAEVIITNKLGWN